MFLYRSSVTSNPGRYLEKGLAALCRRAFFQEETMAFQNPVQEKWQTISIDRCFNHIAVFG